MFLITLIKHSGKLKNNPNSQINQKYNGFGHYLPKLSAKKFEFINYGVDLLSVR